MGICGSVSTWKGNQHRVECFEIYLGELETALHIVFSRGLLAKKDTQRESRGGD